MSFTTIRHIAVHTDDHFREAAFYKNVFGMKKITNGMTDQNGDYDKERGHYSDGVIGLALLQRQPGTSAGLDHFGFAVEDVEKVKERLKQHYPEVNVIQSQSHVPFAGLRSHDPDGNQFDLSQKGMANVREGYVEFGWDAPRWINHLCIRTARPGYLAEFYEKIFELKVNSSLSDEGSFYVTDGKVHIALRPWSMVTHRGLMAGLDHFGFQVDDLEQTKKDLEAVAQAHPASAARKIAIGRDGEKRQQNLEGCKFCKHPLADPDGILLDLTD